MRESKFTTPLWVRCSFVILGVLFGWGAVYSYENIGLDWGSVGLGIVSAIAALAFLDSFFARLVLGEKSLVIVENFKRREIGKDQIKKVVAESGVPVAIQLNNGEWLKVPNLGHSTKVIAERIHKWSRKSGAAV